MKFKVGDKVRIRKDLVVGRTYGGITNYSFLSETDGHLGVQTITRITNSGNYRLNKATFTYSEEMLEPVEEEITEKLVIYRNGSKTIAKYYKDNKTFEAEAKCSPEDEYDFKTGAELAMNRVMDKAKEEEIGYSWVKCVGYRQKLEFCFTVGKEYKIFNNGNITNDDGYTYASGHSKKDALDFLSKWYIFEEI